MQNRFHLVFINYLFSKNDYNDLMNRRNEYISSIHLQFIVKAQLLFFTFSLVVHTIMREKLEFTKGL